MKKLIALLAGGCLLAVLLVACGGGDSSTAPSEAPSAPESVSAPEPASEPETSDSVDAGAEASPEAVNAIYDKLVEAANLGTTIPMAEIDLKAGGINVDNVATFAGAESQTYSDNGGIVIVIQAQPGAAATVASELEAFKESRMDDRYAEFATQLANTKEGRIVTEGDYVVFAVSATGQDGGWDALDAAISEALAGSAA